MASNKKKVSQFQEMAQAILNDKFPELTEGFLGFQVIPSSIEEERMAGVIAVLLGGEVSYIPLIFNGGNISGEDVIYLSKKGIRVPATSAWISALNRNSIEVFSSFEDVSGLAPENATISTDDYIIKLASASRLDYSGCGHFGSLIDKEAATDIFSNLKEDITVDLKGFIKENPHLSAPIEKMARDTNVVNSFIAAGYDANDLDSLYSEFASISHSFEKQAALCVKPKKGVKIIKVDDEAMKELSTSDKTITVRKGYFIDDKRPIDEVATIIDNGVSSRSFMPITSSGFYNLIETETQEVVAAYVHIKSIENTLSKPLHHYGSGGERDMHIFTGKGSVMKLSIEPSDNAGYHGHNSIMGSSIKNVKDEHLEIVKPNLKSANQLRAMLKKKHRVVALDTKRLPLSSELVEISVDQSDSIVFANGEDRLSRIEVKTVDGRINLDDSVVVVPSEGIFVSDYSYSENCGFMKKALFEVSIRNQGFKTFKVKKDTGTKTIVVLDGKSDVCLDEVEMVEKLACQLGIHAQDVSRITTALNDAKEVEFLYKEASLKVNEPEVDGSFGVSSSKGISINNKKKSTKTVKYNPAMLRSYASKVQETDEIKEVFDIKTLSHLFEMDNTMHLKKGYVKNLVKAMDSCGSLIILFSWDKENQVSTYGDASYEKILTSTISKFRSIGDLILFINEKSDLFDKAESEIGYLTESMS